MNAHGTQSGHRTRHTPGLNGSSSLLKATRSPFLQFHVFCSERATSALFEPRDATDGIVAATAPPATTPDAETSALCTRRHTHKVVQTQQSKQQPTLELALTVSASSERRRPSSSAPGAMPAPPSVDVPLRWCGGRYLLGGNQRTLVHAPPTAHTYRVFPSRWSFAVSRKQEPHPGM